MAEEKTNRPQQGRHAVPQTGATPPVPENLEGNVAKAPATEAAQELPVGPAKKECKLLDPGDKTAQQLRQHLIDSWTPAESLDQFGAAIQNGEIKSAEQLYRAMEQAGLTEGTLRKAGKWLWGVQFEPADAMAQTPADELVRIQTLLKTATDRNHQLNADKLLLQHQLATLEDKVTDMTREITTLRMQVRVRNPQRDLAEASA